MKISYEDEYAIELLEVDTNSQLPQQGNSVIIADEEWSVENIVFYPEQDAVLISLTQNLIKAEKPAKTDTRLGEMQSSIMQINKRQDSQERRSRLLREQMVSVRTYLRTQARTPK